jgi:hypothetical protein
MAETATQPKEWTLMFYMASDNPLVISIVSQLKALKAAGYHPDVNVIAQFDPYAEGTPTHVFDVNLVNKLKNPKPNIGFASDDPHVVRDLIEDKLWRHETDRTGKRLIRDDIRDVMKSKKIDNYDPALAPELNGSTARRPDSRRYEPDPYTCLDTFLNFCCEKYPAHRYMLFLLGHGVVVGNDIFLYDEHAEKNSITLREMGDVLNNFKDKIEEQKPKGVFELLSFNSCSVSSLEVAYELKNTANYMLASQGPTFVGSWPYREILMNIFKDPAVKDQKAKNLLTDIFDSCLLNSFDFLLAGYSYQMTLCNLAKISDVKAPIEKLAQALIDGLEDKNEEADAADDSNTTSNMIADLIVYAHWKSQSFFQEMYTDVVDFCNCLVKRIEQINKRLKEIEDPGVSDLSKKLNAIWDACMEITTTLAKPAADRDRWTEERVVVAADCVGPAYQYSNGFSVYFPWTEPSEDSHILQQYREYKFSEDFTSSWFDFLKVYFETTRRLSRKDEEKDDERIEALVATQLTPDQEKEQNLREDISSLVYRGEGQLGGFALNKSDPRDKTGNDCDCPSFKNYPRDTRARKDRKKQAQGLPVGDNLPRRRTATAF